MELKNYSWAKYCVIRHWRSDQFAGYFADQFAGFYTELFSGRRPDLFTQVYSLLNTQRPGKPDHFFCPFTDQFTGLFTDKYTTYFTD